MKTSVLEIVEAVAVCAWLLFPVVLEILSDYPPRRKEKPPRQARGVRLVNH